MKKIPNESGLNKIITDNLTNNYTGDRMIIGTYKGKPLYRQIIERSIPAANIQDPMIECPSDLDEMISFEPYYKEPGSSSIRKANSTAIDYGSGTRINTDCMYIAKDSSWKPNNLYFVLNGVRNDKVWAIIEFTSIND